MRLCVITDEISQNLDHALDVCESLGIRTVELRVVGGENIVSVADGDLEKMKATLDARGFRVGGIASPFLKCHLRGDDDPRGDTHYAISSKREGQWEILERSFEISHRFGAPLVRAFSFWRFENPSSVVDEITAVMAEAARRTEAAGLTLGIENEHACNLGTGEETGWVLDRIPSPALGVIWDPGNEAALGSKPFPDGYEHVKDRIAHVHLKDVDERGEWTKMGAGIIDYAGQFRALKEDGYDGLLSIETHYAARIGGLEAATRECAVEVRKLCERAGIGLED